MGNPSRGSHDFMTIMMALTLVLLMQQETCHGFVTAPFGAHTTSDPQPTLLWMQNKKRKKNFPSSGGGGFGSSSKKSSSMPSTGPSWALRFPFAGSVRPGKQSPQRLVVDESIVAPDYAADGIPKKKRMTLPWVVEVKTPEEIVKMKKAGALAREILDMAGRAVRPGVTTDEIDTLVHDAIVKAGAYPSPLNYHGFPKSCCTSINEVICHGIPDDRELQLGDIVNIDITVYLDGYHGDCSEMFVVGSNLGDDDDYKVEESTRHLLQTTYDCWIAACQFVKPGNSYKDIGGIIEDHVVPRGFSTVKQFCGHGIGSVFHTNPNILHYKNNEPNGQMAVGHTFTIEPMICQGTSKALTWPDEWTATTADGKRSAQFEHTLLVTEDGVEALTGKTASSPVQFWERESKIHKGVWLGTSKAAKARAQEINNAKLHESSASSS